MKILRSFVITALVLLLSISSLQASDTRVSSLGYLANLYVRDNYNIWDFPSTLTNYPNLVIIESEYSYDLWSGGIHLPLSSNFTFGIYLRNSIWSSDHTDTQFDIRNSMIYPMMDSDEAAHQFTVFGAYRMNNTDIALSVSSYSSKEEYTNPQDSDDNYQESLTGREFTFGISMKANERSRFDGSLFYSTGDFSSVYTGREPTQVIAPEGFNTYGAIARLFYAYTSKVIFIPFLGYASGGEGYRDLRSDLADGSIVTYRDKYSMLLIGLGVNIMPVERTLVTLAAGYQRLSSTSETTLQSVTAWVPNEYSYSNAPFLSVGLEARLTKWLGARFSVYELLQTWNGKEAVAESDLDEAKITGSSYAANFGLWFKLGRFTIDAIVDTDGSADFLHRGPFILSGNSSTLFSKLSITYNFNQTRN